MKRTAMIAVAAVIAAVIATPAAAEWPNDRPIRIGMVAVCSISRPLLYLRMPDATPGASLVSICVSS